MPLGRAQAVRHHVRERMGLLAPSTQAWGLLVRPGAVQAVEPGAAHLLAFIDAQSRLPLLCFLVVSPPLCYRFHVIYPPLSSSPVFLLCSGGFSAPLVRTGKWIPLIFLFPIRFKPFYFTFTSIGCKIRLDFFSNVQRLGSMVFAWSEVKRRVPSA